MNLAGLRGLIVSIQPEASSVLSAPAIVAELAACALANGAAGVRIESAERIAAVRARNPRASIVGLLKRKLPNFEPYITASLSDIDAVLSAGADLVAFDATSRARPDGSSLLDAIERIHAQGAAAFADCAVESDAKSALACGADIVSTTLCGYTADTKDVSLPAFDLVARMKSFRAPFTVCEGGIGTPEQAAAAFASGADAIVVGTALTNIDLHIRRFVEITRLNNT